MEVIGSWLFVGILAVMIIIVFVLYFKDDKLPEEQDKTNDESYKYPKILGPRNITYAEGKAQEQADIVSTYYRKVTAEDIYSKRVEILENIQEDSKLKICHKAFYTDIPIGASEVYFYLNFLQYSKSQFDIYVNTEVYDSSLVNLSFFDTVEVDDSSYYPDLLLLDNNGIYYDIEIDEPYSFIDRTPIHYIAKDGKSNDFISSDFKRNKFFKSHGCVVVRFAEQQIFEQVEECIRYIEFISENIASMHIESIREFSSLGKIQKWTYEESSLLSDEDYRISYIPRLKNKNKGFFIHYNDDKWMLLGAEYLPEETIEKIGSATIYEKNNKLFIRIKWAYDGIPNKKCGISPNSPSHCIGDIVDKESIYLEHYINEMGKKLILATYRALE